MYAAQSPAACSCIVIIRYREDCSIHKAIPKRFANHSRLTVSSTFVSVQMVSARTSDGECLLATAHARVFLVRDDAYPLLYSTGRRFGRAVAEENAAQEGNEAVALAAARPARQTLVLQLVAIATPTDGAANAYGFTRWVELTRKEWCLMTVVQVGLMPKYVETSGSACPPCDDDNFESLMLLEKAHHVRCVKHSSRFKWCEV